MIGIIFGFVFVNEWYKKISTKRMEMALWITCAGFFLITTYFFDTTLFYLMKSPRNIFHIIYFALYRLMWGCAIAILICACEKFQTSNFIGKFLSHPIWLPISRLSLSMYLTHMLVINTERASKYQVNYLPFWSFVSKNQFEVQNNKQTIFSGSFFLR